MNLTGTFHIFLVKLLMLICLSVFAACSTGIESTKKIKMTREDRRLSVESAEEILASSIRPQTVREWYPGKAFIVADNKVSMIYDVSTLIDDALAADSLTGSVVRLSRIFDASTPGGGRVSVVELKNDSVCLQYNTGRNVATDSLLSASDMPFLLDVDVAVLADSLLRGRTLWSKSRLWYDTKGDRLDGEKFCPVTITSVVPGNVYFPLRVCFTTSDGRKASMYMNISSRKESGNDNRTFPSLFLLEDPRSGYPSITDENWDLICKGRVTFGMTKQECRLALGNPVDVISGHDWDSLLDAWRYSDGSYLQFQDGLLINFRN